MTGLSPADDRAGYSEESFEETEPEPPRRAAEPQKRAPEAPKRVPAPQRPEPPKPETSDDDDMIDLGI
ncbi:MAG: hypothetical protein HYV07_33490 [Deltaproteobacteria bacterium]|nr:hypothetical protein [Deltaproteobacteria bacterium]